MENTATATPPVTPTEQILCAPRLKIARSPLNPRTRFPDSYIDELAVTLRKQQITPLIVRSIEYQWERKEITNGMNMDWRCVGGEWRSIHHDFELPKERQLLLTEDDCKKALEILPAYQLIAGECRWRASDERTHPETGETLPAMETLQLIVRELGDADVLETMLTENMQRNDLTEIEQADGFERALQQKDANGLPVYATAADLAKKIGKSPGYVGDRLALKKLTDVGRVALSDDLISFQTAVEICYAPTAVIAQIEDEVLHPRKYNPLLDNDEPLNAEETRRIIREKYSRTLRGAAFAQDDPDLVPVLEKDGVRVEGGACTDCPLSVVSRRERFCLNPVCFAKKVDAHSSGARARAEAAGHRVLTGEEAQEALSANSPFVELDDKPSHDDRARSVDEKQCPAWRELVSGETTPPVVTVVDGRGHVHELVERKLAITAAQKNRKEKFLNLSSGRAHSVQQEDYEEQKRREAEKARERGEVSSAIMAELVRKIEECGMDGDFCEFGRELAIRHAGTAGVNWVCKRRGIEQGDDAFKALRKAFDKMETKAKWGLMIELLLAQDWSYSESPQSTEVVPVIARPILKFYKVDAKAVISRARAEITGKKKSKAPQADTRVFVQFDLGRVMLLDRFELGNLVCADPFHPPGQYEMTVDKGAFGDVKPADPAFVKSEYQRLGIAPTTNIVERCTKKVRWAIRKLQDQPPPVRTIQESHSEGTVPREKVAAVVREVAAKRKPGRPKKAVAWIVEGDALTCPKCAKIHPIKAADAGKFDSLACTPECNFAGAPPSPPNGSNEAGKSKPQKAERAKAIVERVKKKRIKITAEARAKIAEAARKRWAAARKKAANAGKKGGAK